MSDHDPGPLPDELRRLVDDERRRPEPGADVRARIRSRLELSLGLGAGGAAAGAGAAAATTATAAKVGAATIGLKLLAGALMLGAVAGLYAAIHHAFAPSAVENRTIEQAPTVAVVAPPPAIPVAATPAPAPASPPLVVAVEPATPARRRSPVRAAAPVGDDLAAERALLDQARTSLSRGDAAGALALVTQHGRRFAHGQLAEERDSLWIRALAAAGEGDPARSRASQFRRLYPTSIFLPAVDATLRSLP